ncbi:response regulator [bacterium]|nr:MAG: response regulator [bacterium]
MIKILIVDDEVEICNIFYDFFTPKGYEVIKATSGKEAIELVKTEKPNLVFLDIRMPVMDGMEALKKIKEIDQSITVIMVTVLKDEKTAKNALKLGAYDYVTKPLGLDYLEKAAVLVELYLKGKE